MSEQKTSSYNQILKSSSLIGGAQGINMLIGLVRVKLISVLIGPAGYGLLANFQALVSMLTTVSGMGLGSSAVRDVAQANGLDDTRRVAQVVRALRRTCWITGLLGLLAMVLFAFPLSKMSFGSDIYAYQIMALAVIVLMSNIAQSQRVVIQGHRRIADLASMNILSAFFGSVLALLFYSFLGPAGIAPALIAMAVVQLVVAYFYSKKIDIEKLHLNWQETWVICKPMLKLGLVMMYSGFLVTATAYLIRLHLTQELGLEAVGIYSAAFALSSYIVNFILGAMAADYYPRLTEVNDDHGRMRELVSQQTEIGLLLATPFILVAIALSPLLVRLLYTAEFTKAEPLLRWFLLGCLGRVISWPLGFVLLAKGDKKAYFFTETFATLFHLVAVYLLVAYMGQEGAALAYFTLYLFYTLLLRGVVGKLISYKWDKKLNLLIATLAFTCLFAAILHSFFSEIVASLCGLFLSALASFYCLRYLVNLIGEEHKISKLLRRIGIIKMARH